MRISDWSSDVCSSDLHCGPVAEDSSTGAPGTRCRRLQLSRPAVRDGRPAADDAALRAADLRLVLRGEDAGGPRAGGLAPAAALAAAAGGCPGHRSEEHTYELQSLMRISYAVFCLKKKK